MVLVDLDCPWFSTANFMTSVNDPSDDPEKHEANDQLAVIPDTSRARAATLVLEEDPDASPATLVYRAKVAVLNDALQEIGMGRYQW